MLAQHKMPAEYESWGKSWETSPVERLFSDQLYEFSVSWVLCNDCEQKSFAKYHFLYHKCAHCGSYNTRTLKTYEKQVDEAEAEAQVASTSAQASCN